MCYLTWVTLLWCGPLQWCGLRLRVLFRRDLGTNRRFRIVWFMVHVRTVRTASGATAVQIVHSNHFGKRDIEHIGSAHTPAEVALLKVAARQRISAGQGELDLGLDETPSGPKPRIVGSRAGLLWGAITQAYAALGLDRACGGDDVFFGLVAARIIEPTSKLDSLRVIEEAGTKPPSYRTV